MKRDVNLKTPVRELWGVGKRYGERLERMGLHTVRNLLLHLPRRYEDFSDTRPIASIRVGETVTVRGTIRAIHAHRARGKRLSIIEALIEDDTGAVRAVWFNQTYLVRTLPPRSRVSISGTVSLDLDGAVLSNPAYEKLPSAEGTETLRHTGGLIPVYPETHGITSRYLRYLIESILPVADAIEETLPEETRKRRRLPALSQALRTAHRPATPAQATRARKRLAFDELLALQLLLLRQKRARERLHALAIPFADARTKMFVASLPFRLTDAQRKAAWEIIQDIGKEVPMTRLLEGDVGSGKTVVAMIAALQAAEAGMQTAFMAPTEILAQQHYQTVVSLWDETPAPVLLLTSSRIASPMADPDSPAWSRATALDAIRDKKILIIIGTHALIQRDVEFRNLAIAVVDEQHRFGIKQRAELLRGQNGSNAPMSAPSDPLNTIADLIPATPTHRHNSSIRSVPHLLSMSATPIPRTLALALYGDLELSVLDELPLGRKAVDTRVVPPAERDACYEFIREQLRAGRQAFVVCPLIENSPALEARSVQEEYEKLHRLFPEAGVAILHGQLPPAEKETTMRRFANGDHGLLVCTSVVEVGIDVPNAAVMMVEGAERFGLAQLYQFRGRVGRGEHPSFCFLLTDSSGKRVRARLNAITRARSGLELAEEDLRIRGPGQFLGTQQSGIPDLAMASLKDLPLIKQTREEAALLLRDDPTLKRWPPLRRAVATLGQHIHPE